MNRMPQMVEPTPYDCDLCEEIRTGGTFATGSLGREHPLERNSRLIRRTAVVDTYAGLGGLVPGYTLIVPRRHALSCGELDAADRRQAFRVAWNTAQELMMLLDQQVILVEHGSSLQAEPGSNACIDHAHIHLFPLPPSADPDLFKPGDAKEVVGTEVLDWAASQGSYYYCSWQEGRGLLVLQPALQSQHARQVWASLHGRPDEWDWALFPEYENAQATVGLLRRDSARAGDQAASDMSGLRETLAAYAENARWYADRTASFNAQSTLEAELRDFVADTRGMILDAGAGGGRDSAAMAALGREVIALDAVPELLKHVKASAGLHKLVADIRDIPLPSDSIGGVWCSAVLLHLNPVDALAAMREFYRVLRTDGLLQVSVKRGNGHVREPMNGSSTYHRHFYFYDQESLEDLAASAGLALESCWTECQEDSSDNSQIWLKCRFRKTML
jgi:SAM-dependent methyltransferase/diadenosine tetraphosphate (Ap4A) HIT family hydrolase